MTDLFERFGSDTLNPAAATLTVEMDDAPVHDGAADWYVGLDDADAVRRPPRPTPEGR